MEGNRMNGPTPILGLDGKPVNPGIAPEPEKMPEHVKAAMQDVIDKVSSQDQDPEEAAPAREAGGLSEVGGGVKGDRDG